MHAYRFARSLLPAVLFIGTKNRDHVLVVDTVTVVKVRRRGEFVCDFCVVMHAVSSDSLNYGHKQKQFFSSRREATSIFPHVASESSSETIIFSEISASRRSSCPSFVISRSRSSVSSLHRCATSSSGTSKRRNDQRKSRIAERVRAHGSSSESFDACSPRFQV